MALAPFIILIFGAIGLDLQHLMSLIRVTFHWQEQLWAWHCPHGHVGLIVAGCSSTNHGKYLFRHTDLRYSGKHLTLQEADVTPLDMFFLLDFHLDFWSCLVILRTYFWFWTQGSLLRCLGNPKQGSNQVSNEQSKYLTACLISLAPRCGNLIAIWVQEMKS